MGILNEDISVFGKKISKQKENKNPFGIKPLKMNTNIWENKKEKKRDSKRGFNESQKNNAYDEQNGFCAKCKNPVKRALAQFHHIKFHSKGGLTKTKNCQMLCPNCHADIHNKERVKIADKKRKPTKKLSPFERDLKKYRF